MQKQDSNKTIDLLYQRASCRSFLDKEIEPHILDQIIGAGLHSPTGGNLQPYCIIKITSEEKKKRLVDDCEMQHLVYNAPVDLLFCIDWRRIGRWAEASNAPFTATNSYHHFWIAFQDTVICAQNICTAADALGLGSVYIGSVEDCFMKIKSIFNIPKGVFPVVLLSLGYPAKHNSPSNKLDINAIVHDEEYNDLPIEDIIKYNDEKYNHKTLSVTEERLSTIYNVVSDVYDESRANEIVDKIKEQGYINTAQRYFGLHYRANWACSGNQEFIDTLVEHGFDWIKG